MASHQTLQERRERRRRTFAKLRSGTLGITAALCVFPASPQHVLAETSAQAEARNPRYFHSETGFRIERYHAPTPEDVPGPAVAISPSDAAEIEDAVFVDVFATRLGRYDELDGTWLGETTRDTVPGAVWLPEVGRGNLSPEIARYFRRALGELTKGDKARPLVIFCVADCWMAWNAARRATDLGYERVFWMRDGTDGWLDAGLTLAPVPPMPLCERDME